MATHPLSRRNFIKTSAAATAAMAATRILPGAERTSPSPNERLRLAFIGVGGRAQEHLNSAIHLQNETGKVEIAAVCDVFNRYLKTSAERVRNATGHEPKQTGDYRDLISDDSIDAVVISTPDHWHAKQTLDALRAGKHVYCEKPMTHSVEEAVDVYKTWKDSGRVMQVGVQGTAMPHWNDARRRICDGQLGKVLMYQTSYFRNSDVGQWRYYELSEDMTPKNIDWRMFLGTEFDLATNMPFDRAKFAQWRCYWDFGAGMYTDLFVHRTAAMLAATGLRFPGRVVGAGGIYFEYDGRDVPDVATVVADFPEGVQGVISSTMSCQETPLADVIRGHNGSFVFGVGEGADAYDFVAERPQATHDSKIKSERIPIESVGNSSLAHFENFCEAAIAGKPEEVNCTPELGAASMIVVKLGAMSYRDGKVYHFDPETLTVHDGDGSWARRWEEMSHSGASPKHVPGWKAGDTGSKLYPPEYQKLAGPWIDGVDPARKSARAGG